MKTSYKLVLFFGLLGLVALGGCAGRSKVYRVEAEQEIDLSGRWNDTDSQKVSATMIQDCTSAPWIGEFIRATGDIPALVVGTIYNKTDEHISADVFIKDLERAFIDTGRARIVTGGATLDELRAIRQSQRSFSSPDTRRYLREELGADFIVQGTINKITDIDADRAVYFYQVDLEVVDIETTEKRWSKQEKLKKFVEKGRYAF